MHGLREKLETLRYLIKRRNVRQKIQWQLQPKKIKQVQRAELAQLERNVLLQIFDGVLERSFVSNGPGKKNQLALGHLANSTLVLNTNERVLNCFEEMFEHIQDRVSDLVFKARMQVSVPPQAQQEQQQQQAKQQSKEQPRKQAAPARSEPAETIR